MPLTYLSPSDPLLAPYRWDVVGFARDFLGIELHKGQKRAVEAYLLRGRDGWHAAFHTIALSAGNRAGKTLLFCIIILHACIFKIGLKPPASAAGERAWLRASYFWFHFAIAQEIAELVFSEIMAILAGIHPAQKGRGCRLAEVYPVVADGSKKFNGDYRWIVFAPELGGAEVHFRTTGEKGIGSLGRDMHGISFDECGLERNLRWIVDNVLHLRRLGTGGQLFLFSTPEEGLTEFADMWYLGEPAAPDRQAGRVSLRMSTRDNIGYGLSQGTFDELTAEMDVDHIKQNIDGYFIQGRLAYFNNRSVDDAFDPELPEREPARRNGVYVQGLDPALKYDSTFSVIFQSVVLPEDAKTGRITLFGVRVERLRGKQTTESVVALAADGHNAYDVARLGSRCSTAVDATGFGGKLFKDALEKDIPFVRAIEFGGSVQAKRKLLGDLRTMLDEGRILMPRYGLWLVVRRQLLGYKLHDDKIETDAVMALACAVAEARRSRLGVASVPFDLTLGW